MIQSYFGCESLRNAAVSSPAAPTRHHWDSAEVDHQRWPKDDSRPFGFQWADCRSRLGLLLGVENANQIGLATTFHRSVCW